MVKIHQIECLGRFHHVLQKFGARDARQAGIGCLGEAIEQVSIGQLHDNQELAVDDFDTFEGEQKRMSNRLDAVERAELLLGPSVITAITILAAEDELDGLVHPTGGLGLPDLAVAPSAKTSDEPVAWYGLGIHCGGLLHGGEQRLRNSLGKSKGNLAMTEYSSFRMETSVDMPSFRGARTCPVFMGHENCAWLSQGV